MKIGFEAKRVFNNFTGLGNYGRSLLSNLNAYFPEPEYYLYTPKIKETPETLPFIHNPSFHISSSTVFPKAYWRSFGVTKQLEQDGIDLYHGLSHELPFNIKGSNLKSIVTIHDLIFKRYPETYPWMDRKIYDFKFKKSCQQADIIIAISESTKRDIVYFYDIDESKIKVVYQSCNPIYYQPKHKDIQGVLRKYQLPQNYYLFVGSVEIRKNVKLILQAYRHLPKESSMPLVIIGRASQGEKEILSFIQSEGLAEKVYWLKNLADNSHLKAIYHQAEALIYPSLYEGFGLPVAEALLSEVPVITSNTSSLPEAGGPHSLQIDPQSPEDLAKAMEKVNDRHVRAKMIKEGLRYAQKHFGRKVTTERLMEIYRETIHSK